MGECIAASHCNHNYIKPLSILWLFLPSLVPYTHVFAVVMIDAGRHNNFSLALIIFNASVLGHSAVEGVD